MKTKLTLIVIAVIMLTAALFGVAQAKPNAGNGVVYCSPFELDVPFYLGKTQTIPTGVIYAGAVPAAVIPLWSPSGMYLITLPDGDTSVIFKVYIWGNDTCAP